VSRKPVGPSVPGRFFFSVALRLYPQSIRKRFGEEMRQFFVDDHRDSVGRRRMGTAHFYFRSYWRTVTNGIGARLQGSRSAHGARPAEPGGAGPLGPRDGGGRTERLGDWLQTIRYAARGLARNPGFTSTSILTLALGIGACTLIFSVMYPVLITPLPYPESHEILSLQEKAPGPEGRSGWVSPLTFRDWEEHAEHFDDFGAWRLSILTWTGGAEPKVLSGWAVSAGYFPSIGMDMTLGRAFTEEEDRPGGERVVVLTHAMWTQQYGADREVLGRTMTLDGEPHVIIGVAHAELAFPSGGDYLTPIGIDYGRELRDFRYLGVIGRLGQGSTLEDGRTDLERISAQVALENPDTNAGWGADVTSLKEDQVGSARPILMGMTGAVGLLLIIALGNVTNLSVARSVGRQTESAVRTALGAKRGDLARSYMVEGLLLSIMGSALGLIIAFGGIGIMGQTVLASLPRAEEIVVDGTTVAFTAGAALVVGLLLGILSLAVPAGASLSETLRAGGSGGTAPARANRMREIVLTTQVAFALSLVIGATLLTRSLIALGSVDAGFEPTHLLAFSFDLPRASYPGPEPTRAFYREVLAGVRDIPGVDAAGAVTPMPMEMGSVPSTWFLSAEVRPSNPTIMAHMRTATPGYFQAMGIRLVNGRAFDQRDQEGTQQTAMVNEAFVQQYLNGHGPVGTLVSAGDPGAEDPEWLTIVGVVGDVRFQSLRASEGVPEIYLPAQQLPTGWGHLVVRASGPAEPIVRAVSAAVQNFDPDLPLADVRTGADMVGRHTATSRLSMTISSIFAAAATALAVVGILGVLSISLAQRVKEIGLRMVLGAPTASIRRFAITKALRPVMVGLVLGLVLSVAASRFLESQVFGISQVDPLTYVLATLGFAGASFLACLVPSLRAAAVDPLVLLRSD